MFLKGSSALVGQFLNANTRSSGSIESAVQHSLFPNLIYWLL